MYLDRRIGASSPLEVSDRSGLPGDGDVRQFSVSGPSGAEWQLSVNGPVQPVHVDGDVPDNDTTTVDLAIGGSYDGELEVVGDRDWIRVELVAGQEYSFGLNGTGGSALTDPYLRLYDADGNLIVSDDDGGPGRDALVHYTASTSGTYYLEAGSYNDSLAGTYTLTAEVPEPLTVFTEDEIAHVILYDFWGTDTPVRWDRSSGDILTVDLTGLTDGEADVARSALALWTDVTGLIFQEVSSGANITFDDELSGAYANISWNGSYYIQSATINIDQNWLSVPIDTLYSYWLQTYIHEIGHSLGLGHTGNYNGSADYYVDAAFANDSHQASIMSYFWPSDNPTIDADFLWTLTPQIADIIAVQSQYGTPVNTRDGNTVYGFNSTAGRDVFDATLFTQGALPSITIFDSGGIDTLDYSGFTADQYIDLTPGSISNIGGMTGNLIIAFNTVIERVIGGSGANTIVGNDADNVLIGNVGADVLNGMAGNDFLVGAGGNDQLDGGYGDDILDGGDGDDTLLGNDGADRLFGRDGADTLTGGTGDDILVGGDGADVINGQSGFDRVRGGNDNDAIHGGGGNDSLYGQNGNDEVWGDAGDDFVQGGADDDIVHGGDGDDRLGGGGGNDTIFGDAGNDIATGNGGNDEFTGGAGNDRFDGGGGQADRAIFSGNFADYQLTYYAGSNQVRVVDLRTGSPDGTDTLFGTEILEFANGEANVDSGAFNFTSFAPQPGHAFIAGLKGDIADAALTLLSVTGNDWVSSMLSHDAEPGHGLLTADLTEHAIATPAGEMLDWVDLTVARLNINSGVSTGAIYDTIRADADPQLNTFIEHFAHSEPVSHFDTAEGW